MKEIHISFRQKILLSSFILYL